MRARFVLTVLWAATVTFTFLWMYAALYPRELPRQALRYFTQDFLERSSRRARLAYLNSGLATIATFSTLYWLAGRSSRPSLMAGLFRGPLGPGRSALLGLCLGAGAALFFWAVRLPFGIYRYYLDRSFGLTPMTLSTFMLDYAKELFLSAVQYSFAGAAVAWAWVRFPRTWHLLLSGLFVVVGLLMSALYPVLVAPMFNAFHPLPEGEVLQDVRYLATSAGMQVDRVLVMEASAKTSRANAYFAGVGRTKQVVLYDTLLQSHSREEIRLVVAHELAHWKFGHIVKGVAASSLGVLSALLAFTLCLSGGTNGSASRLGPDALALERFLATLFVFVTLVGFVFSPLSGYVSRTFEARSDEYSLALAGDRQAFIASQVRLATTNLADVDPPGFIKWFASTHPSTLDRILSASR